MNRRIKVLPFLSVLLVSAFSLPQWLQAQAMNTMQPRVASTAKSGDMLPLRRYVQDMNDAHVGMTRRELKKIFHPLPGLSDGQTWAYNRCPSIWMKVIIEENPKPSFDQFGIQFEGSPSDRVTALGKPYWNGHNQGSD